MRVEVAFAVPLSAAIWTTYSPGAENRAVVTGAFAPPNASSTSGEATTTAVAFPAVFSSSRLVREFFSVWLMNHLVLRVLEGRRQSGRHGVVLARAESEPDVDASA